jgi:hypothetical protein
MAQKRSLSSLMSVSHSTEAYWKRWGQAWNPSAAIRFIAYLHALSTAKISPAVVKHAGADKVNVRATRKLRKR